MGQFVPAGRRPVVQLADLLGYPPAWQDRASCRGTWPEAFFPEKGESCKQAKRVCLDCPVRSECLEYALATDERFGIWGGMTEQERKRLKRRRAQLTPPPSLSR